MCKELQLDAPYLDISQDETVKGKPYKVIFSRPETTDGMAVVYSEKFIQIKWLTRNLDLPREGSEVFKSLPEALEFLENF